MASIEYRPERPKPYRVHIKRKGHGHYTKSFLLKQDAERYAREEERSIDLTGTPRGIDQLKKHTVKEIVTRYLEEKTPDKSNESEIYVLNRFKEFAKDKSLASFTKQDAYAYRAKRLKDKWKGPKDNWRIAKPITARTVAREIGAIRPVFEVAREEWGFINLTNPFADMRPLKGSKHRRKRRLEVGELESLIAACNKCLGLNRTYVPLAIYLAVETGMRLDEIFNLTWEDMDFKRRRIEIRKSKTDHLSEYDGRTIVMSLPAMFVAQRLLAQIKEKTAKLPAMNEPVFPMTKDAFEQSFDDALKRAKIVSDKRGERLQFRDLRREANSRFDQMLTVAECELMLGHKGKDTNSIYRAAALKSIQAKLDAHLATQPIPKEYLNFLREKSHSPFLERMRDKAAEREIKKHIEGKGA